MSRDESTAASPSPSEQFFTDVRAVVAYHWSGLPERRPDGAVWARLDAVLFDDDGQERPEPDYSARPGAASSALQKPLETPIAFGLRAQGHLETVTQMRKDGRSWEEIGREIGWTPEAVERSYDTEASGLGDPPFSKHGWIGHRGLDAPE